MPKSAFSGYLARLTWGVHVWWAGSLGIQPVSASSLPWRPSSWVSLPPPALHHSLPLSTTAASDSGEGPAVPPFQVTHASHVSSHCIGP